MLKFSDIVTWTGDVENNTEQKNKTKQKVSNFCVTTIS